MNEVSKAVNSLAGKASFQLAKFILFLTRIFTLKFAFALCPFIVFVASKLKWKRKNIALNNLKIVFPEKTDKERKVIFRESLRNLLKGIFEMAFIFNGKYSAKEISKMASGSGLKRSRLDASQR